MNILLHICCGICASSVAERLMRDGHVVTGFFYNPNIHPVDEYKRRLQVAREVSKNWDFELVEGPYDRENWFREVKGLEYEPECGRRCNVCFEMRLKKTYEYFMNKRIFGAFTTTLTVSPLKKAEIVNRIGREIGGENFLCADFKKKDGFKRAMELSKEWDLFRQHYCGCIYSKEAMLQEKEKHNKE